MDESEYPPTVANLNEQPQYKTLFKEIKSVVKEIAEHEKFNAELLASRRQINQLLSVHWGSNLSLISQNYLMVGEEECLLSQLQSSFNKRVNGLFSLLGLLGVKC